MYFYEMVWFMCVWYDDWLIMIINGMFYYMVFCLYWVGLIEELGIDCEGN